MVQTRLRGLSGRAEEGDVPGLLGWRYRLHGAGCRLTGPDGEVVDTSGDDELGAIIDPWFFAWRIESIRARELPERRLWRWAPSAGLLATLPRIVASSRLIASVRKEGDAFRLCSGLEDRFGRVAAESFADEAAWRAALGDDESDEQLEEHRAFITDLARDPEHAVGALEGAAVVLRDGDFLRLVERVVRGRVGAWTGKALELVGTRGDEALDRAARKLLERLSPAIDPPSASYQALAYLFGRGARDDLLFARFDAFAAVEDARGFRGNPFLADYASLALRFSPERAMPLVRRALRSPTPLCVSGMAALLAAIDRPWCLRELAAALTDRPGQAAIAEALKRSSSVLGERRAKALYVPPEPSPLGAGFSFDEVMHENACELLDSALKKAKPLADVLRDAYPPSWEGS